jgi:hypothetical protein
VCQLSSLSLELMALQLLLKEVRLAVRANLIKVDHDLFRSLLTFYLLPFLSSLIPKYVTHKNLEFRFIQMQGTFWFVATLNFSRYDLK